MKENTTIPKQLTLQQAIEQGYTHFLYADEQYQVLQELESVKDYDYEKDIELVNKEPELLDSYIDEEDLREWIAEQVSCQHSDETGDDTDQVFDALEKLPLELFTPIIEAITEKMKSISYYKSSGIKLVK